MLLLLLFIITLPSQTLTQQTTSLTQPPYIQTSIIKIQRAGITTVTYTYRFEKQPLVYLSIVSLKQLRQGSYSTFMHYVDTANTTAFDIETLINMTVAASHYNITMVQLGYLAYDYDIYSFLLLHTHTITPSPIPNQYLLISYLSNTTTSTSLNHTHTYQLNIMITGYQGLTVTNIPSIYIDAIIYDHQSYLLHLQMENVTVQVLWVLRVLLDQNKMKEDFVAIFDVDCNTGTIYHSNDPLQIVHNETPDYLPFAMLYGIKGWQGLSFDLPSLIYIFTNSDPPIQVHISYMLFQLKTCPANQSYVAQQDLCYGLAAAFFYQLTPQTMAPCPYSCYQCEGPLSSSCKSCVQGYQRQLSSGRCLCMPGFYDPGAPSCLNCTQAIEGCYSCNNQIQCVTCLSGCTAIGFNPIYCDCPGHVQSNYTFNCEEGFYYQHDMQQCQCLPQTYLDLQSALCFPCQIGCYICIGSSSYCLLCIDSYLLLNNRCIFYYSTYSLLGLTSSFDSPQTRCLRWDSSNTLCLQTCSLYYYDFNCYGVCPQGTFNISFPWLTCQPCKISCKLCYNFTVCLQCHQQYFYFNSSSFACQQCSEHCIKCINNSNCLKCQQNYQMINGTCQRYNNIIGTGICPDHCEYCGIGGQCLDCQDGYYLNRSMHMCSLCIGSMGFYINDYTEKCQEICGDGIVVYQECDDGNTNDRDGCSAQCTIQQGYTCNIYQGQSYCWKDGNKVGWHIYHLLGTNQLILQLRPVPPHALLALTCSFPHHLLTSTSSSFKIQYQSSLVLPLSFSFVGTSTHISNVNSSNRCILTINDILTYSIVINPIPQPLLVDYSHPLQSILQSQSIKNIATAAAFITILVTFIGLTSTGFASLRLYILIWISYLDYYQVPINAFSVFQALYPLTMTAAGETTKMFGEQKEARFEEIGWKIGGSMIAVLLFHLVAVKYGNRRLEAIEWNALAKISKYIITNKHTILLYVYTAYQPVLWVCLFTISPHLGPSSPSLISLSLFLLLILISSKIHFFLTFSLSPFPPYLRLYKHILLSDTFLNFILPLLLLFCSNDISYTPLILILFCIYNFGSLVMTQITTFQGGFRISQSIGFYLYCSNMVAIVILQMMKMMNMWRSSSQNYEKIGVILGLAISILSYTVVIANGITILVTTAIRICEIRFEGEEEGENINSSVISIEPSAHQT